MLYLPSEEGQGLVEYALVIVFIAVVVVATVAILGGRTGNLFSNIVSGFREFMGR